jgi:hypothetical protein
MNRRYLIDNVCLWCARAFVAFFLISLLGLGYFFVRPAFVYHHMARTLDVWVALLALGSVWIICLMKLRATVARYFLGLTATLYLLLLIWDISIGYALADSLQISFTSFGLIGFPSMIWLALRPTHSSLPVSQI